MKTEAMLCGKSAPRMSLDGADAMELYLAEIERNLTALKARLWDLNPPWRKEASYWKKSDHSCVNGLAKGVAGLSAARAGPSRVAGLPELLFPRLVRNGLASGCFSRPTRFLPQQAQNKEGHEREAEQAHQSPPPHGSSAFL
jgi:hypothetical protein